MQAEIPLIAYSGSAQRAILEFYHRFLLLSLFNEQWLMWDKLHSWATWSIFMLFSKPSVAILYSPILYFTYFVQWWYGHCAEQNIALHVWVVCLVHLGSVFSVCVFLFSFSFFFFTVASALLRQSAALFKLYSWSSLPFLMPHIFRFSRSSRMTNACT